jgi:hypothetical protein
VWPLRIRPGYQLYLQIGHDHIHYLHTFMIILTSYSTSTVERRS